MSLIGRSSTRGANFWPSLTLLFWYKLLKTAHVYVHFLFFSQSAFKLQFTEEKLTFKNAFRVGL